MTTANFTHGFHPYPAKFPPDMVKKFLTDYCRGGDTILDPFCGSGTALVESALVGINAVGIDLNPIACLASRAKTNHYGASDLQKAKKICATIRQLATTPTDKLITATKNWADKIKQHHPLINFP